MSRVLVGRLRRGGAALFVWLIARQDWAESWPPRVRIPHHLAMAIACLDAGWTDIAGWPLHVTRDSVRMARRMMYFTTDKAIQELGDTPRRARLAIRDSVRWFQTDLTLFFGH